MKWILNPYILKEVTYILFSEAYLYPLFKKMLSAKSKDFLYFIAYFLCKNIEKSHFDGKFDSLWSYYWLHPNFASLPRNI